MKYPFDLHLHSCLSPCGGEEMTPANVAGWCALNGIRVAALTDHNSVKNCPFFLKACENYNILGLPGMELTTREEVHVVVLFGEMEGAEGFSREIQRGLRGLPPNDPAIFGPQWVMDEEDHILEEESLLLAGATDVSISDVSLLAQGFGGFAYPAHIDRDSFSLLSNLGLWDPSLGFSCGEVSRSCPPSLFHRPDLQGVPLFVASDAHYLDQIMPAHQFLELETQTRASVLKKLNTLGQNE